MVAAWGIGVVTGMILGLVAQVFRQIPGPFMYLGAATFPWVMVGFLLAVWASRRATLPRRAIWVATGTMAAYLTAWLVAYHLLFVIHENVSLAAGWRQTAPWLVLAVPASPFLGTIAAWTHKRGLLGDACIAVPIAGALWEAIDSLQRGWSVGAYLPTVTLLAGLLIWILTRERRVSAVTLLVAVTVIVGVGLAIAPIFWFLRRF